MTPDITPLPPFGAGLSRTDVHQTVTAMATEYLASRPVKQPEYVEWWITITRDHGLPDMLVGPYSTEELAVSAMNESLLVQGFVEENCLECEVTPLEVVLIDQDDVDHFGTVKP